MKNPEMHPIRQGDVLLTPVAALPPGAVETPPTEQNKIILALGEATGHHHRIEDVIDPQTKVPAARLWTAGFERFLQVLVPVALKHEEHSAPTLPPGIYKLPRQVEYTPAELRRVVD